MHLLHNRWGIGLGFFSTQASEHGNKMAKNAMKYLNGFTDKIFNKFDMYIRDRMIRILHFPDTIRKPLITKDKCSRCEMIGHRKNNKSCPLYDRVDLMGGVVDAVESSDDNNNRSRSSSSSSSSSSSEGEEEEED